MKHQILYILAFKDEPLIKVGLAVNARLRSLALGYRRFDFKESYLVRSKDQPCIRTLERNLKTFFAAHQVSSTCPMPNGNTETFDSSVLPEILQSIETFRSSFPHAEFQIEQNLSSLIPPPRPPRPPRLEQTKPGESTDQPPMHPRTLQLLDDLHAWCDEQYGRRSEVARFLGISPGRLGDWLTFRRTPTADHAFIIQDFLKKHRRHPRG
jgi:hypothetical protein